MLVLSRRLHESIVIKDDIKVTIVGIEGNKIKLGIEAPEDIVVDREEVYLRKQEAQEDREERALIREEIREGIIDDT